MNSSPGSTSKPRHDYPGTISDADRARLQQLKTQLDVAKLKTAELAEAIRSNRPLQELKDLVAQGATAVGLEGPQCQGPLHLAVIADNAQALRYLLGVARLPAANLASLALPVLAAREAGKEVLACLLEAMPGMTGALHACAHLAQGVPYSLLWWAADAGNVQAVDFLLGCGARVEEGTDTGTNPLLAALFAGREECALRLVQDRAASKLLLARPGPCPVHLAVGARMSRCAVAMIEAGASLHNVVDGESVLTRACRQQLVSVVDALLAKEPAPRGIAEAWAVVQQHAEINWECANLLYCTAPSNIAAVFELSGRILLQLGPRDALARRWPSWLAGLAPRLAASMPALPENSPGSVEVLMHLCERTLIEQLSPAPPGAGIFSRANLDRLGKRRTQDLDALAALAWQRLEGVLGQALRLDELVPALSAHASRVWESMSRPLAASVNVALIEAAEADAALALPPDWDASAGQRARMRVRAQLLRISLRNAGQYAGNTAPARAIRRAVESRVSLIASWTLFVAQPVPVLAMQHGDQGREELDAATLSARLTLDLGLPGALALALAECWLATVKEFGKKGLMAAPDIARLVHGRWTKAIAGKQASFPMLSQQLAAEIGAALLAASWQTG